MIKTTTTTYQITAREAIEILGDWLGIDRPEIDRTNWRFIDVNGDEYTLDHVIITEKN